MAYLNEITNSLVLSHLIDLDKEYAEVYRKKTNAVSEFLII